MTDKPKPSAQPEFRKLKEFFNSKIRNASLPAWCGPLMLFVTCFFSFGILLSRLGFFQDDWHHVYYAYAEGVSGLMRFLFTDSRPLAFIAYVPLFKLLGFNPANWHWSLMILRFLTVLTFWYAVRLVWPNLTGMAVWLALLFAVYPAYPLQSLSVAYSLHWIMYLVFMLSVVMMLKAARNPKSYLLYTGLALILQLFHLLMIEYYSGLEFVRLILLWFVFSNNPGTSTGSEISYLKRWKQVLKQWLPYLLVLGIYAAYRMSYHTIYGYDRFTSNLLNSLIHTPMTGIPFFIQTVLQDSAFVLISPWIATVDPALIDFSRGTTFVILAIILGFSLLGYFVVSRLETQKKEETHRSTRQIILTGALAMFFGLLPPWLADMFLFSKNPLWSGRLALGAILGASMLLTGFVYLLVDRPAYRHLVLSILLGLAVGFQAQTARDFQTSWDKQLQFYWQMSWRAPGLQPNTMVVADSEILPYMGYYPTAFALNVLYGPQVGAPGSVNPTLRGATAPMYWFNNGSEHMNWTNFQHGQPVEIARYSSVFTATNQAVLSITFEPQQGQCLWVLRPSYSEVRSFTDEAYRWMAISNLNLIQPQSTTLWNNPGSSTGPPSAVFGSEPKHTWCYYYEKADLASQQKNWQTVTGLWKDAKDKGFHPGASIELIPFIEAEARTGDWTTARELTNMADVLPPVEKSLLCSLWREIETSTTPSGQRDQVILQVKQKLGCQG